jgi:hypothetical protein
MVPFNPPFLVVVELVNGRCIQQNWPTFALAMECLKKYKPGTMEAKVCDKSGVIVKFTY